MWRWLRMHKILVYTHVSSVWTSAGYWRQQLYTGSSAGALLVANERQLRGDVSTLYNMQKKWEYVACCAWIYPFYFLSCRCVIHRDISYLIRPTFKPFSLIAADSGVLLWLHVFVPSPMCSFTVGKNKSAPHYIWVCLHSSHEWTQS
jgi:hypothetical protein